MTKHVSNGSPASSPRSKLGFFARVKRWRRGRLLDRAERLQVKAGYLIKKAYELRGSK